MLETHLVGAAICGEYGFFIWQPPNMPLIVVEAHRYYRKLILPAGGGSEDTAPYLRRGPFGEMPAPPPCSYTFLSYVHALPKRQGTFLKACFLTAIYNPKWATHEHILWIIERGRARSVDFSGAMHEYRYYLTEDAILRGASYVPLHQGLMLLSDNVVAKHIHLFSHIAFGDFDSGPAKINGSYEWRYQSANGLFTAQQTYIGERLMALLLCVGSELFCIGDRGRNRKHIAFWRIASALPMELQLYILEVAVRQPLKMPRDAAYKWVFFVLPSASSFLHTKVDLISAHPNHHVSHRCCIP